MTGEDLDKELTPELLKSMVELLRKEHTPPFVVATAKRAREMTRNDPLGRKWKVGDEYYKAETFHQTIPVHAGKKSDGY